MERKKQLDSELKRITKIIVDQYEPERIILFGSMAHGEIHEWSDIDLAIVKDTTRRFIDRIGDVFKIAHPELALNVIVYTPEEVKKMLESEHTFWIDEINNKGKVLYDRAA